MNVVGVVSSNFDRLWKFTVNVIQWIGRNMYEFLLYTFMFWLRHYRIPPVYSAQNVCSVFKFNLRTESPRYPRFNSSRSVCMLHVLSCTKNVTTSFQRRFYPWFSVTTGTALSTFSLYFCMFTFTVNISLIFQAKRNPLPVSTRRPTSVRRTFPRDTAIRTTNPPKYTSSTRAARAVPDRAASSDPVKLGWVSGDLIPWSRTLEKSLQLLKS